MLARLNIIDEMEKLKKTPPKKNILIFLLDKKSCMAYYQHQLINHTIADADEFQIRT